MASPIISIPFANPNPNPNPNSNQNVSTSQGQSMSNSMSSYPIEKSSKESIDYGGSLTLATYPIAKK